MKKSIFYGMMSLAFAFGAASCSEKDNDKTSTEPLPDPIEKPSGTMQVLSPEESKEFVENTAVEFMDKFDPADQEPLLKVASYASANYDDLELPENFEFFEDEEDWSPISMVKAFAAAFAKGDITRAAYTENYVYSIDFDKFKGIYEPGYRRWNKVGNSNDVIFRFTGPAGSACVLKAELSSSASNVDIEFSEEDYDYWEDADYIYNYNYKIKVPKEVKVTLTENGKSLVNAVVKSDINLKNHNLSVNVDATAANLNVKCDLKGSDSSISETSSLYVSGEKILETYAVLNGKHLCDYEYWINLDDDYDDEYYLSKLLTSGNATVSVLNSRMMVDAKATYSNALYEAFDTYYDSWEYDSQNEALNACNKAIKVIESNISANVTYNNTTTVQARLAWQPYFESWYYDEWEYYPMPVLKFADGTTYEFEKYFANGFGGVESAWRNLQRSYERLWNSLF